MKKIMLPLLFGTLLLIPQIAHACTVPVFRFALERWDLTPYEVVIYHRGPLAAEVKELVTRWNGPPARANIEITVIDLDQDKAIAKDHKKLWDEAGNKDAAAWMIVPSLSNEVAKPIAWSGPCTPANLQAVLTSPVRQAILAHLSRGSSIVYVMLTSADVKADEQVHAMLTKKLAALEKQIKLPVQSDDGNSKLKLPLPLKVSLPLLVLDRNDAQEAAFIRLLLATEEDMDKAEGPIVFPIFGRGRLLGSLYTPAAKKDGPRAEFPSEQIDAATNFLCKECSCMVKDLNPGTDLLMPVNWGHVIDEMFEGKQAVPMPTALFAALPKRLAPIDIELAPLPPAPTMPIIAAPPPESVKTIEAPAAQFECPLSALCKGCSLLWLGAGLAGVMVLVTGGWLLYRMWA